MTTTTSDQCLPGPDGGDGNGDGPGDLRRGVALSELLGLSSLAGARVVAGGGGLDRRVESLNVMEVPDILDWVRPRELLLTTAYPLRDRAEDLTDLVSGLDDAGLAGLAVKLGRYLDALPSAAVEVAEERGFPLLVLPEDAGFDELLTDALTHILADQTTRLERADRIHRTFLEVVLHGRGVDAIADELAGLVDAPTAIVDLDGAVLASSGLDRLLDAEPDVVDLSTETGHLRVGPNRVPVRVAGIAAGSRLFGHLVVGPTDRDGSATSRRANSAAAVTASDARMAIESAATVAALALSRASELQAVESKYQSDLLHDLLTGRTDAAADVHRRARSFGWELQRRLIALVLRTVDPDEHDGWVHAERDGSRLARMVSRRLHDRDPQAAIVQFSDEVVVLTGAFEGPDARAEATTFLDGALVDANRGMRRPVSGGVSRPIADLGAIPRGYEQAVTALAVGRRVHGPGRLQHFDDLGAYRLLSLIDADEELRSFATEVLGDLAADDETTRDLRTTLEVLLETNLNVAESSRRLHFHYNTLRYRIDKLETIVGPFMADAQVRLNVQLALLIHDMHAVEI